MPVFFNHAIHKSCGFFFKILLALIPQFKSDSFNQLGKATNYLECDNGITLARDWVGIVKCH